MAIRTREEILTAINERLSGDTSDEALSLLGDISDTITDLEGKANNTVNWEQKYKENDAQWRQKYRDRFFSGNSGADPEEPEPEEPKKYTYDELFKEG